MAEIPYGFITTRSPFNVMQIKFILAQEKKYPNVGGEIPMDSIPKFPQAATCCWEFWEYHAQVGEVWHKATNMANMDCSFHETFWKKGKWSFSHQGVKCCNLVSKLHQAH